MVEEPVWGEPEADDIALRPAGGGPFDPGRTVVVRATVRVYAAHIHGLRRRAASLAENAQRADGEPSATRHGALVRETYIPRTDLLGELDVLVLAVRFRAAAVKHHVPELAVLGELEDVAVRLVRGASAAAALHIVEVHLHRPHGVDLAEVDLEPFAGIVGGGYPRILDALVERKRSPAGVGRRRGAFPVGEQHPARAGISERILRARRDVERMVAQHRVRVKIATLVEHRGDEHETPVEAAHAAGVDLPPAPAHVLEERTVSGALREAGGLPDDRTVERIRERPHRRVGDIAVVAVGGVGRSRYGAHHVVASVRFRRPRTFLRVVSFEVRVEVAGHLETAVELVRPAHVVGSVHLAHAVLRVEFYHLDRIAVRKPAVEVDVSVAACRGVVVKHAGVHPPVRLADVLPQVRIVRVFRLEHASALGMAEIERVANHACRRRVLEELLENALRDVDLHECPLRKVGREPVSVAMRGEEPVLAFENDDRRIGRLHVNALRQTVRADLPVAVVDHVLDVDRIARCQRLRAFDCLNAPREIVRRTGFQLDARVADLVVDPRLLRLVRDVVVVEQLGDLKPTAVRGEAVERTPRRHPHARCAVHRRHLLLEG